MKKKIAKTVIAILLLLIGMVLFIIAYYLIANIESKSPKELEATCKLEVNEFMSRKVFVIKPKEEVSNPLTIVYFHGGSYVAEATREHWDLIEKIVNNTGATVIMPDYPLTPKYNYQDVFNMVIPLYKEIIEKIEPENLMFIGDSAGGGLALALEEYLSKEKIELPQKTILISPWLDVRLTNEKIEEVQKKDKVLSKEKLILAGIAYAGEDGINSYLVNPIEGDLSGLKNIVIMTGTNDILNPDVSVLVEKAKQVGVEIKVREYDGASHIWIIEQKENSELIKQGWEDFLSEIQNGL